jgi:hypothetical protein
MLWRPSAEYVIFSSWVSGSHSRAIAGAAIQQSTWAIGINAGDLHSNPESSKSGRPDGKEGPYEKHATISDRRRTLFTDDDWSWDEC